MAIKLIERDTLTRDKAGWRWSRTRKKWITYQVDYYRDGVRHNKRGFLTETEAQRYLQDVETAARMRALGLDTPRQANLPSVADLFAKRLEAVQGRKQKALAKRVYADFRAVLPPGATIGDVRTRHFREYAEARLATGVKPATVNREITVASSALSSAPLYYPAAEDWTPPKKYYVPAPRSARERVITDAEAQKLLEWLNAPRKHNEKPWTAQVRHRVALVLECALLTGLRHSEICAIRWQDVAGPELRVFRSKTNSWTTFPMHEALVDLCRRAEKFKGKGDWVFSTNGALQCRTGPILKQACEACGIPYGRDDPDGITLHSARHTAITRLVHAGVDLPTIKSFSGHTSNDILLAYAHATPEARERAADVLFGKREPVDLKAIYEKVKAGEMTFEEFEKAL